MTRDVRPVLVAVGHANEQNPVDDLAPAQDVPHTDIGIVLPVHTKSGEENEREEEMFILGLDSILKHGLHPIC